MLSNPVCRTKQAAEGASGAVGGNEKYFGGLNGNDGTGNEGKPIKAKRFEIEGPREAENEKTKKKTKNVEGLPGDKAFRKERV